LSLQSMRPLVIYWEDLFPRWRYKAVLNLKYLLSGTGYLAGIFNLTGNSGA